MPGLVYTPRGLAFDAKGNLYEADGSFFINEFTPSGNTIQITLALMPWGLAFDSSGNLFVSQQRVAGLPTTIYKITPNGTQSTFATGLGFSVGLAFDAGGSLIVADSDAGIIYKYAPSGSRSVFASGLTQPAGLAFDSSGNLFEADVGSGDVFKFSPGGNRSTFTSGLRHPWGLAFDAGGNLFVTENFPNGNIYDFAPNGTRSTFAVGAGPGGLGQPYMLAFAPVPEPSGLILVLAGCLTSVALLKFKSSLRKLTNLAAVEVALAVAGPAEMAAGVGIGFQSDGSYRLESRLVSSR